MKIAIVVHGRFHAFDLARELLKRGHEVALFTNYPKWAVEKFGIPKKHVKSFWIHGVFSRLLWFLHEEISFPFPEAWLHVMFGKWAAKKINNEDWDAIYAWSGISEEIHLTATGSLNRRLKLLIRGSAHIRTQARILNDEEKRVGIQLDRPSSWIIAREEREYYLADLIIVLSNFAKQSFIEEGVPKSKIRLLPLGAKLAAFRPSAEIIEARCNRILRGDPLRLLYVGALSFQKGLWDLNRIIRSLATSKFHFCLVGPVSREAKSVAGLLHSRADVIGKQPQNELYKWYAQADVFIFPTLQDGYAAVLAQAVASGLPVLTTTNCSGPDFIREGETGWILPIRNPEGFIARLEWCDEHRRELAEMVKKIYDKFQPRDWSDVARDFEQLCKDNLKNNGT